MGEHPCLPFLAWRETLLQKRRENFLRLALACNYHSLMNGQLTLSVLHACLLQNPEAQPDLSLLNCHCCLFRHITVPSSL
jgi:hypothetical protein